MSSLMNFVETLSEMEGAITERIVPNGLEILAPAALQKALAIPELVRLGFGAEQPMGAQRVTLESDWMERLAGVIGTRGRNIQQILDMDTACPSSPERMLQHTLELTNATYQLKTVRPAWTRYLLMTFRYSAISEEKRDGVLHFGINLNNGSTLDNILEPMLDMLEGQNIVQGPPCQDRCPAPAHLPQLWQSDRLDTLLRRALPARIERCLERFLSSMRRRQKRDLARIYDYHADLRGESLKRLHHLEDVEREGGLSERQQTEFRREHQRLGSISREYRAKVDDLAQKYAMSVECEWIQTRELIMPVQRFELLIRRRKGERHLELDWNPLARRLEHPPCEYRHSWERARAVCDDKLHLVDPRAHEPCVGCGKSYCRACHAQECPRCSYNKPNPGEAQQQDG